MIDSKSISGSITIQANNVTIKRSRITGGIDAATEQFGAYQELGLEHVVLEMSTQSHAGTLATMEAFAARIRPQLSS